LIVNIIICNFKNNNNKILKTKYKINDTEIFHIYIITNILKYEQLEKAKGLRPLRFGLVSALKYPTKHAIDMKHMHPSLKREDPRTRAYSEVGQK